MTTRRFLPVLLAMALLVGCQEASDGKLKVGILDTSRILTEMPKYKDLQADLAKQQLEFQRSLPNPGKELTQEEMMKIQKDADKRQAQFQKRVDATVQMAIKEIRELASQVAQEKKLDMVVVHTPFTSSVYYHSGQDVTIDVVLKMKRN